MQAFNADDLILIPRRQIARKGEMLYCVTGVMTDVTVFLETAYSSSSS